VAYPKKDLLIQQSQFILEVQLVMAIQQLNEKSHVQQESNEFSSLIEFSSSTT